MMSEKESLKRRREEVVVNEVEFVVGVVVKVGEFVVEGGEIGMSVRVRVSVSVL